MRILAELPFYNKAFTNNTSIDKLRNNIISILYNENNEFYLNKGLINKIDENVENKDFFQSIIKELSDSNRICQCQSNEKDSYNKQAEIIYDEEKKEFIIPIVINNASDFNGNKIFTNIINISNMTPCSNDFIVSNIIINKICTLTYSYFKTDDEICQLFENVFKIPKFIKNIYIFNREQDSKFLKRLKNKNIYYCTIMKNMRQERHNHLAKLADMRKNLGGKLKIFYTSNSRLIHERKIIIDGFIITSDNSAQNMTVQEPTWMITLTYSKTEAERWLKKLDNFRELNQYH